MFGLDVIEQSINYSYSSDDEGEAAGEAYSPKPTPPSALRASKRKSHRPWAAGWIDTPEQEEVMWSSTSHEKLQIAFMRDAPRTHLELDGLVVDDFDAAFWTILKLFGWQEGSRVIYMCTGEALAPSYDRAQANVVEDIENTLLVQSRDHLFSIVNSENRTVQIQKAFHLIQLEPHMIQSKWQLVKTYNPQTNLSIDEWKRDVEFQSVAEIAEENATLLEVSASEPSAGRTPMMRHIARHLDQLGSCGSDLGFTTAGENFTSAAEGDADSSSEYDSDCTLVEHLQFPPTVRSPLALIKPSAFAPPTLAARPSTPSMKKRILRPKRVRHVSPAPMVVGGLVSWLSESEAEHDSADGGSDRRDSDSGGPSAVGHEALTACSTNGDGGQHWSMSESDPGWSDHSRCPSEPEGGSTSCTDPTDPDTDACDNVSERGRSPPVTPSRRRARSLDGPASITANGLNALKRVGGSSNSLSSAAGSGSDEGADDCWTVSPNDPEHEWDLDMSQVTGGITFDAERRPRHRRSLSQPMRSKSADTTAKSSGRRLSMRSMVRSLLEI